jgi:PII-like signaling protein
MSPSKHKVISHETGMVRIFLRPADRRKQPGLRGFFASRPLYRDIIDAAKKEGIMNAHAHHTHYGYSNHGKIRAQSLETGNPELTVCVELIAPKDQLEEFCGTYGDWLTEKVIVYKHLEHWGVRRDEDEPAGTAPRFAEATST